MLTSITAPIKGSIIVVFIILNTLIWLPVLVVGAILKMIFPLDIIKRVVTKTLIGAANNWVWLNSALFEVFHKIEWHVSGLEGLKTDEWYLVNSNHQSWADIPVVQKVLNRRIPMLKFFLKQELIWVPFLGICWWALDFPFMKRYSAEDIRKNPSLAGKDLETTRKACEKFKTIPVSVFNFLEGTRFTKEKHSKQQSPFENLLKPKAGGAAFVLGSMGQQMHTMLDISIIYPDGRNGAWDLVCGRIPRIVVHIDKIEIPRHFLGKDYANDDAFKAEFQSWVNDLWIRKDALIKDMKQQYST